MSKEQGTKSSQEKVQNEVHDNSVHDSVTCCILGELLDMIVPFVVMSSLYWPCLCMCGELLTELISCAEMSVL